MRSSRTQDGYARYDHAMAEHKALSRLSASFSSLWTLLVILLAFAPGLAVASTGFLTDVLGDFAVDSSRVNTCGSCHAAWTGGGANGDHALTYKLWDHDTATAGMSPASFTVAMLYLGLSHATRLTKPTSSASTPFADVRCNGWARNLQYD